MPSERRSRCLLLEVEIGVEVDVEVDVEVGVEVVVEVTETIEQERSIVINYFNFYRI